MASHKKIELEIVALSHSVTQSNNYAVVLGEKNGNRRLPIVIGGFEAQAIAVAMESMNPNRPLTHDLFKNTLSAFNIVLKEIIITDLIEGIFYAQLICDNGLETIEIDSRTSDAIAMAVRFECSIFTYDFILESAGVILENSTSDNEPATQERESDTFSAQSINNLKDMLTDAINDEDYEKAAKIRDEIKNRGGKS